MTSVFVDKFLFLAYVPLRLERVLSYKLGSVQGNHTLHIEGNSMQHVQHYMYTLYMLKPLPTHPSYWKSPCHLLVECPVGREKSLITFNNKQFLCHMQSKYRYCCLLSIYPKSRGVMVKVMDCGIVVREFVLQSRYYVHFRANTLAKGMNPLVLPAMG